MHRQQTASQIRLCTVQRSAGIPLLLLLVSGWAAAAARCERAGLYDDSVRFDRLAGGPFLRETTRGEEDEHDNRRETPPKAAFLPHPLAPFQPRTPCCSQSKRRTGSSSSRPARRVSQDQAMMVSPSVRPARRRRRQRVGAWRPSLGAGRQPGWPVPPFRRGRFAPLDMLSRSLPRVAVARVTFGLVWEHGSPALGGDGHQQHHAQGRPDERRQPL
jgi:hypothetical protein